MCWYSELSVLLRIFHEWFKLSCVFYRLLHTCNILIHGNCCLRNIILVRWRHLSNMNLTTCSRSNMTLFSLSSEKKHLSCQNIRGRFRGFEVSSGLCSQMIQSDWSVYSSGKQTKIKSLIVLGREWMAFIYCGIFIMKRTRWWVSSSWVGI